MPSVLSKGHGAGGKSVGLDYLPSFPFSRLRFDLLEAF